MSPMVEGSNGDDGRTAVRSDDERLVEGLERGEPDAIERLVDRYGAWIHRVAARLLADPRDAEEITQDVLMTVVQKIGTFKREAAFSSWLYRIAANAAYERLRSPRSRVEVPLEPLLGMFDDEGRHVRPVVDWSARLEDPAPRRAAEPGHPCEGPRPTARVRLTRPGHPSLSRQSYGRYSMRATPRSRTACRAAPEGR
jgi:RNA polymerase sigma factor (sigma-70 family)